MQEPPRVSADRLRQILEDEEACVLVFFKWRWPRGFVCPRCTGRDGRRITGRPAWRCTSCNHHARLTAGTALHRSRLPLSTWLQALVLVGDRKQSISAMQLQKDLGFGCYRTAFKMLHIIRDVMEDAFALQRGLVEFASRFLDHSDVRAPGTRDDDCICLAIAVERLQKVDLLDEDNTLPGFSRIKLAIVPGDASLFDVLRAVAPGVPAEPSDKPITRIITRNFVDWLRGTFHGISAKYLATYVREFMFRFNHRRHASILPAILGKRLMRRTSRRRCELKTPRALLPPKKPRVFAECDPSEIDVGDDSGEREEELD